MEKIVLDTDVLIGLLRNDQTTTELVKALEKENELGATDINAFELYRGAYKSNKSEGELAATKGLLNTLFLAGTNAAAMELAAKIIIDLERKGNPVDIRDLFIGSICLVNSFKLLTRNKKHFEKLKGLKLV